MTSMQLKTVPALGGDAARHPLPARGSDLAHRGAGRGGRRQRLPADPHRDRGPGPGAPGVTWGTRLSLLAHRAEDDGTSAALAGRSGFGEDRMRDTGSSCGPRRPHGTPRAPRPATSSTTGEEAEVD